MSFDKYTLKWNWDGLHQGANSFGDANSEFFHSVVQDSLNSHQKIGTPVPSLIEIDAQASAHVKALARLLTQYYCQEGLKHVVLEMGLSLRSDFFCNCEQKFTHPGSITCNPEWKWWRPVSPSEELYPVKGATTTKIEVHSNLISSGFHRDPQVGASKWTNLYERFDSFYREE